MARFPRYANPKQRNANRDGHMGKNRPHIIPASPLQTKTANPSSNAAATGLAQRTKDEERRL